MVGRCKKAGGSDAAEYRGPAHKYAALEEMKEYGYRHFGNLFCHHTHEHIFDAVRLRQILPKIFTLVNMQNR